MFRLMLLCLTWNEKYKKCIKFTAMLIRSNYIWQIKICFDMLCCKYTANIFFAKCANLACKNKLDRACSTILTWFYFWYPISDVEFNSAGSFLNFKTIYIRFREKITCFTNFIVQWCSARTLEQWNGMLYFRKLCTIQQQHLFISG